MTPEIWDGVVAGIAGAGTVAIVDGAISRTQALNRSPLSRGGTRLAAGVASAYAAKWTGAPRPVIEGIVAGCVMMTLLDAVVSLCAPNKVNPPQAPAGRLGEPWGPVPRYALPPLPGAVLVPQGPLGGR
jgi:hypothetical protein